MKIRVVLIALVASFLFTACGGNSGTSLTGSALGTEELILVEVKSRSVTDTLAVIDLSASSEFKQKIEIDSLKFLFLYVNEQYNVPLLVTPGDQIEVSIDATAAPYSYTVSGSGESEGVKEILDITRMASEKVDSLSNMLRDAQDSSNFAAMRASLDAAYLQIVEEAGTKFKDRIDNHPNEMANIYIFSQSLGNRPILAVDQNFEYLEKVAQGINETYPGHSITASFNNSLEEVRQQVQQQKQMEAVQSGIAPGTDVPEISMMDPDGNLRNLSDLRGKVVLVDFWAAWCKPCRMENPNLVRMYNKFKSKGFDVFSVSLDGVPNQQNPREQWLQAIEQDQLEWPNHVSDLRGWGSEAISSFGFQGIPYTVLVDAEGKVIQTNLRGPALEQKLTEVLGE